MSGVYVLLMIWSTSTSYGGIGVVQQEFTSLERCEAARIALVKAHERYSTELRAQGCFKR